MAWFNDDGLQIPFGPEKAIPTNAGEYNVLGGEHWVEIDLDLTTLTDTSAIINDYVFNPKNVRVDRVEVIVETVTAGSSSTLTVGLMKTDRASIVDEDGILAASHTTWHTAVVGKTVIYRAGDSEAGSSVGPDIGNDPTYFTAKYGTAAFTQGKLKIRVFYIKV